MMTQSLQSATKAILRGKFIEIQSYLEKQEKLQMNKPNLIPTAARGRTNKIKSQQKEKNIIKIKAEINEIEKKRQQKKRPGTLKTLKEMLKHLA